MCVVNTIFLSPPSPDIIIVSRKNTPTQEAGASQQTATQDSQLSHSRQTSKKNNTSLSKKPKKDLAPQEKKIQELVAQYLTKEVLWTDTKDAILQKIVSTHPFIYKKWEDVATEYNQQADDTMTAHDLYTHFNFFLKSRRYFQKSSYWNENKTAILQELVTPYIQEKTPIRWSIITRQFNEKVGDNCKPKQVRTRYVDYIDPSLDWSLLEKKEKIIILTYVKEHGTRWAKISRQLEKKRSHTFIKNWFYTLIHVLQKNRDEPASPPPTPPIFSPEPFSSEVFTPLPLTPLFEDIDSLKLWEESVV